MKAKIGFLVLSSLLFLGTLGTLVGFTAGVILLSLLAFFVVQFSFYAWSFYNFYALWRKRDFVVPFFLVCLFIGLGGLFFSFMGYHNFLPAVRVAFAYFWLDVISRWSFKFLISLSPKKKLVFLGESAVCVNLAEQIASGESEWELLAFLTRYKDHLPPVSRQIVWKSWAEVYTLIPSIKPDLLIWESPLNLEEFSYIVLPEEILDLAPNLSLLDFILTIDQKVLLQQATASWMKNFLQPILPLTFFFKRALDLTLALLILPVCVPLMVISGILTKLSSSGKMLYSQTREGFGGSLFTIYKFRSMTLNAEVKGAQWAQENDSRVTRWGRIMRKLRLDELPQIWNVFKGDMSFVGPRPERPEFTKILAKEIPFYKERNRVKPGLTGWAQINYPYGASVEDALHKTEYDLYYVHKLSLWMDFKILLKTAQVVIMGKGQ